MICRTDQYFQRQRLPLTRGRHESRMFFLPGLPLSVIAYTVIQPLYLHRHLSVQFSSRSRAQTPQRRRPVAVGACQLVRMNAFSVASETDKATVTHGRWQTVPPDKGRGTRSSTDELRSALCTVGSWTHPVDADLGRGRPQTSSTGTHSFRKYVGVWSNTVDAFPHEDGDHTQNLITGHLCAYIFV